MTLAEICVRRPVLIIVLSLLITILGGISLAQLGVREYPAIDPPTLSIVTSYPGASAEIVQTQITEPLEEAVNSVAGLRTLVSVSREGSSQINAEFRLDVDLDTAASDVRDQISRAVRNLPPDANPPILVKANADSTAIFALAVRSETRSQLELSAFADSLKQRLQTVPGVATVDQPAEKRYAMRLWMDPERLAAHGLSPLDVRRALERESIELPSGRIEGDTIELPVKALSRLNTPEEFAALIIKRNGDRVVRFADIGYAELGAQNERGILKAGDQPIAGLYFRPQPGANQIEIVDEIQRRLERIRKELPPDIRVETLFDNTEFVRRALWEVTETLFVAFALVVLVVLAFFREWRSTLIPVLAIPVSIIGVFAILWLAGYSINTLTLLGVVLAIGLVVDDAIVVLENIYAKIENGMPAFTASIKGVSEIFMAVISTTLTLALVFLPLLFMGGLSGRLFREFGVTIAGSVVISAFVALTLTPLLCSRLLKRGSPNKPARKPSRWRGFKQSVSYPHLYRQSLGWFLRHPWIALIVLTGSAALSYALLQALPSELSPLEDRNRVWVRATGPEGVSFEYMRDFMEALAAAVRERVPEARLMITQVPGSGSAPGAQGSVNTGFVRVFLSDKDERERTQQQIAADLLPLQRQFTGARLNITQEASIGERRASVTGVQFVLQAGELEALREVLPQFLEEARKSPVFTFVDSDLKFSKPELRVEIDRNKARALGVNTADIAQTLQAALSDQRFGYFIYNGKQYDVIGQLTRDYRSRPADLVNISVPTADGTGVVRLDNLVSLRERISPPELFRFNRQAAATISGTLVQGRTMSEGIAAFEQAARATLDERFTTALTGPAADFVDSSSSLGWAFALGIVFIYLVLAAQFESFVDPLVILLTVPLALAGALLALWCFGQTLNIFSQIGLIMLVGLVTKNGILIVEFANQRHAAGITDPLTAVYEAASARLRPILMTTLAMVFGILPVALALGAGAESRVSMGIAVIGGLLFGTFLTLYVIPAMFVLLKRLRTYTSDSTGNDAPAPESQSALPCNPASSA